MGRLVGGWVAVRGSVGGLMGRWVGALPYDTGLLLVFIFHVYLVHANVANSIITTTTTSLNTWSHIAVTRDSNDLFTVWINGVDSGNDTFAGVSLGAGHANPKIARQASSAAQYYRGYIDDLRVTNGVCRYTADFTAPTAELPSSAPPQITIPYSIDKLDDVDTSTVAPTDGTTLIYENGTYIPGPVIGGVNYNSGDSDFSSVAALFHFNGTTFTSSGITVRSPEKVLHILDSGKHRSGCRFVDTERLEDKRCNRVCDSVIAVACIHGGDSRRYS